MSRIGKLPIKIPEKVKVTLDGTAVRVEGPPAADTPERKALRQRFGVEELPTLVVPSETGGAPLRLIGYKDAQATMDFLQDEQMQSPFESLVSQKWGEEVRRLLGTLTPIESRITSTPLASSCACSSSAAALTASAISASESCPSHRGMAPLPLWITSSSCASVRVRM